MKLPVDLTCLTTWLLLLTTLVAAAARVVVAGDLLMDAMSAFVDVNAIAGDMRTILHLADEMKQNKTLVRFDDTFPLSAHELGLLFQLYDKCGSDKSLALRTWCTGVPPNGTSLDGEPLCPPGVRTHPCTGRVLDVDKANDQLQFLWPWQGVKCDVFTDPTTVTNIYLPGQGLKCQLQDLDFSYMVSLEQLDLSQNELLGPFPSWLGNMTMLRFLNLRDNDLEGNLPLAFGDNIAIEVIDLASNRLTATSLSFFKIFKRLRSLDLSGNLFNLTLPSGFFGGEYLEHLNLSHNSFHGVLPPLPSLKHLVSLDVSHNAFEGQLPRDLGAWGRIDPDDPAEDPITEALDFSHNRFSGSIPPLLNQSSLLHFAVQENQLTGVVPQLPISLYSRQTPTLFAGNHFLCPLPQLTSTPGEFGNLTCTCKNGRQRGQGHLLRASGSQLPAALAASECRVCSPGMYSNATTENLCVSCPMGHIPNITDYMNRMEGATECAACATGTFANETGSDRCSPCAKGTIAKDPGQASCSACFPGDYMDEEGGVACKSCPPGTASSRDGSVACTACRPGTYSAFDGEISCLPCPRGQFQDRDGSTACHECPLGYIAPQTGLPACRPCPRGMYNDQETKSCVHCPPHTFTALEAQTQCQLCPEGMAADGFGNSQCLRAANAGFGRSAREAAVETECRPGFFNNGSFVGCQPCPLGSFANIAKTAKCERCEPGSFSAEIGATQCTLAPAGSFVQEAGAWRPRRCPPGHLAAAQGASQCDTCPVDTSSLFGGRERCEPLVDGEVLQEVAWPLVELRVIGVSMQALQSNETLQNELRSAWKLALVANGVSDVAVHVVDVTVDGASPASGRTKVDFALELLPPPRVRRHQGSKTPEMLARMKAIYANANEFVDDSKQSASEWFSRLRGKTSSGVVDYTRMRHANLSELLQDPKLPAALSRQIVQTPSPSLRPTASLLDVRLNPSPFTATRAIRCPRGSFFVKDPALGGRTCVPCPVGTHADEEGLIGHCKPCPTRHFAAESGLDQCDECPWGQGAMSGATQCEPCAFFSRACGEFWNNVVLALVVGTAVGLTMWQRGREMWTGGRGTQQQSEDTALVAAIRTFGRVPWT